MADECFPASGPLIFSPTPASLHCCCFSSPVLKTIKKYLPKIIDLLLCTCLHYNNERTHFSIDSISPFPVAIEGDEMGLLIEEAIQKSDDDLTEAERMALLGRPRKGDVIRAELHIKECKDFKVRQHQQPLIII